MGPVQAHEPDTAAVLLASTTADVVLQDRQTEAAEAAAGAKQDTNAIPQALNVCCNGNYGIYLLARRGVQCMCAQCQSDRAAQPSGGWIMSPTEFERHSGMPTAKKWRMRWAWLGFLPVCGCMLLCSNKTMAGTCMPYPAIWLSQAAVALAY